MTPDDPTSDADRTRPSTEASYGIPAEETGMLDWESVVKRMRGDRSYWVTTIRPGGRPHVRPTWGVWIDGAFHCGGGERTRWVQNLGADPSIVVHRGDPEEVVIVEGEAERIDRESAGEERIERLEAAYREKYDVGHGTPFFRVHPERVLAWSEYPTDATRWTFEE